MRILAALYEVETKALNRAVKRNLDRFPEDFMFQLTAEEFASLRFQSGTSSLRSQIDTSRWGGRRYPPYAFTEQVAMLSSVLHSGRAIHPLYHRDRPHKPCPWGLEKPDRRIGADQLFRAINLARKLTYRAN